MNAAVDVLSWLDSLQATTADGAITNRKWPEAQEVRHAVAGLVEALRLSDEWIREAVNFGGCKLRSEQTLYRNSQALARVGGAK